MPGTVPGTNVAALSASLIAMLPDAVSTTSLSVRLAAAAVMMAASLVPTMLTVTVPVAPSLALTVKVSL